MNDVYKFGWWFFPLVFFGIGTAQTIYGRDIFGYAVIPLGLGSVAGSTLFAMIGMTLRIRGRPGNWLRLSTLVCLLPLLIYLLLVFRQW